MTPIGFAYPTRSRGPSPISARTKPTTCPGRSCPSTGRSRPERHRACALRVRVALDATPLLGLPTGIGAFCQGALDAPSARPGLAVQAFAASWRRRSGLDGKLPPGCRAAAAPDAGRARSILVGALDGPPLEIVHRRRRRRPWDELRGAPDGHAAAVVSIHDLTPLHHPELSDGATLAYPGLIRRALARGAWVHADSAFVAGEVVAASRRTPTVCASSTPGCRPA